jgi:hypothetical protein
MGYDNDANRTALGLTGNNFLEFCCLQAKTAHRSVLTEEFYRIYHMQGNVVRAIMPFKGKSSLIHKRIDDTGCSAMD